MIVKYFFIFIALFYYELAFAGTGTEAAAMAGESAKASVAPQALASAAGKQAAVKTAEKAAPALTERIGDFFASSAGVATLAGISTVYSGVLYKGAAEQEEEAKSNITKIDRIMAEFKDSFLYYCPHGRESLDEPKCYCYTDDGKENSDRTKSQICQQLWAANKYKLGAAAGDYRGLSKFVDPVGCLTVNGQFDENCKCKKFLDSKGNNACMKGASISIPSNSFGAALMNNSGLGDVARLAAGSMNGNPNFNSFNSGTLGMKAIQTRQLADSLVSKIISSGAGPSLGKVNEGNVMQLTRSLFGSKAMGEVASAGGASSALAVSASAPMSPKTQEALKAAATKAGIDFTGGRGLLNKRADNKESFAFNLGGGEAAGANGAGQLQDFPEQPKNYKIKGDISKQKDTNIFDIISNRYMQSGLKRLFEE